MARSKVLLQNALDMFDIWGDEAVTDSSRSRTLIKTAQLNDMWKPFEGIEGAALFVNEFSKGWGQRSWIPTELLRFMTSPTTYLKALRYHNGIICHDVGQHYLDQEWITYCHPMTVEEFQNRL